MMMMVVYSTNTQQQQQQQQQQRIRQLTKTQAEINQAIVQNKMCKYAEKSILMGNITQFLCIPPTFHSCSEYVFHHSHGGAISSCINSTVSCIFFHRITIYLSALQIE